MVRNQNIKEGYLDLSDLLHVTKNYDNENRTKRLQAGDVLTIRTGYPGVSAVVPQHLHNAQSFTTLVSRPQKKIILPHFLALWINSPRGKAFVFAGKAGGAQHNLNAGTLKNLPVPIPSLAEQQRIIDILAQRHDIEMLSKKTVDRLASTKAGLLQDLLSGKVRVTP